MPWSNEFTGRLAESVVRPRFLLESIAVGDARPYEGDLLLSSFRAPGYLERLTGRGSVSYGELRLGTWDRSFTSISVELRTATGLTGVTARGQVVQLRVGFTGWDLAEFERVFIGQVRDLKYSGGRWLLVLVDIVGGLTSRFTSDASKAALFTGLSTANVQGGGYAAGDPTLTVGSSAGFEQSTAGGGEGWLIKVTPNGGGDPFYLRAGTLVGNVFGALTRNLYGTTDAAAAAGSDVQEVAYSSTHPINMARRILTSSGTNGANGSRDVLPARWGYNIPVGYVDEDDMEIFQDISEPSGSTSWDLVVEDEQRDAFGWLSDWLRPGGFFLSQHQGSITCRAVTDATLTSPDYLLLTDDLIETIDEYSRWASDTPVEYEKYTISMMDGAVEVSVDDGTIDSRPVALEKTTEAPAIWSNTAAWGAEISQRVGLWEKRIPEVVRVTLRGFRGARVSPGSVITLKTNKIPGRFDYEGHSFAEGRDVLVLGGGPDWFATRTRLTLAALPPLSGEG